MLKTVVGLFDTVQGAQNTVNDLVAAGIARGEINIITQDTRSGGMRTSAADAPLQEMATDAERVEKGEAISTDAVAGALFGGFGGALIGVLALAIPGLGPLVAAGPIAAALAGMTAGAAGGAVIGALETSGITHDDAHVYAEALKRGGTLLAVHVEDAQVERVRDMLDSHGAADIDERASSFRQEGWNRFDHTTEPVSVGGGIDRNTAATNRSDVGLHDGSNTATSSSYVGEGDRSSTQTVSSTEPHRVNPTDTTIMTSTENVPRSSRLRSKVYDHLRT